MKTLQDFMDFVPRCEQEGTDRAAILKAIRQYPDTILTRKNTLQHVTSSAIILNFTLDRILMVYHNLYRSWSWTGGHADGEDDLLSVALREAREETGLSDPMPLGSQMLTLNILPVWGHIKKGRYLSSHLHLNAAFVLLADEQAPIRAKRDENSGVQWFPVADIPHLCANEPQMVEIYLRLLERVRMINLK